MCQKSSVVKNVYKSNPKDMNYDKLEKLLKENAKYISIIRLHGGEPLYFGEIIRLIDLLNQLKMKFAFITNGSLLTPEISKKLMKNCIEISFSIDSVDNEEYSKIRYPGNLEIVSGNIKYLNQLKKETKSQTPILNIAATMFSFNISELPDIINYCYSHKILSISVSEGGYYNTPKVRHNHLIKHFPNEIRLAVDKAKIIAKKTGVILRLSSQILDMNFKVNTPYVKPIITKCINFYIFATVSPSLDIAACALSNSLGNIHNKSLYDVWNGKESGFTKARGILKNKILPDSCTFCKDINTRDFENNQVYSYTNLQEERYQ